MLLRLVLIAIIFVVANAFTDIHLVQLHAPNDTNLTMIMILTNQSISESSPMFISNSSTPVREKSPIPGRPKPPTNTSSAVSPSNPNKVVIPSSKAVPPSAINK
jgi:hypothetical protein